MDMKFAALIHVGRNMWGTRHNEVVFHMGLFEEVCARCAEKGVTDIYLDLGEAVQYKSHPELALPGAMTVAQLKALIGKLREAGLTALPKLNFSCSHDLWLGDYARMVSSKPYYGVVHDLISEVSDIFDGPALFHVGLDEEDCAHQAGSEHIVVRSGNLKWHDINFYMDEVKKAGSRPICWSDVYWYDPENCVKNVSADMAMMPWYYGSLRPEHYRPITEWEEWIKWYARPEYAGMNIQYVEQDPDWVRQRTSLAAVPAAGYDTMPALSNFYGCRHNAEDVMEYAAREIPENRLLGFMTTSWKSTELMHRDAILEAIDQLGDAKRKVFGT